mmetsp:Transcript_17988/g.27245  ORF Transcript_17988/g.27245 Transcript_17988/m.27245 type:complete len:90 (-) Transcript_17988:5872-6141(-)
MPGMIRGKEFLTQEVVPQRIGHGRQENRGSRKELDKGKNAARKREERNTEDRGTSDRGEISLKIEAHNPLLDKKIGWIAKNANIGVIRI